MMRSDWGTTVMILVLMNVRYLWLVWSWCDWSWFLWEQLWLFCKYRQARVASSHQHCLRFRFTWRKLISEPSRTPLKRVKLLYKNLCIIFEGFTFYRSDIRNCNGFCTGSQQSSDFRNMFHGARPVGENDPSLLAQSLAGFGRFSMY